MRLVSKRLAACAASLALVASAALVGCSGQPSVGQESSSSSVNENADAVELQIFAANSLSKAMEEVQTIYTEQTGVTFADTQYEGSSVGNVCSYANSGDVDLAMVYSSDVYRFGNVKQVGTAPFGTHKPILYPAAVCTVSEHPEEAKAFLEWCSTDEDAIKVWQEWGFELV